MPPAITASVLVSAQASPWELTPQVLILFVGLGAFVVGSVLYAMVVLERRQRAREIRELIAALEGMRPGGQRHRPEVASRSAMALVADAANRLGQDLTARGSEAESATARLQALMDAAPDTAVVCTDPDLNVTLFSQAAETLLGFPRDEVQGGPASILFAEGSWKDLLPKLARRSVRERGLRTTVGMIRKDRSSFHADLNLGTVQSRGGEPSGYVLSIRDVSDRVALKGDLRAAETRYRRLMEGIADGVVIVQGGRIVFANRAAEAISERSVDDLGDLTLADLVSVGDVMVVRESLAAVETGAAERHEIRVRLRPTADGGSALVRLRLARVEHETRGAVLVLIADETKEHRIEAELRRNEERLDAVLEATSDCVLVLADTADGGVVNLTNRAFLETFGLSSERVLGASERAVLRMLRKQGGGAAAVAAFMEDADGGQSRAAIRFDGDTGREIEIRRAELTDRLGRVVGRIVVCRDLTEIRIPERRLEAQAEELRSSMAGLEEAYHRLDHINDELKNRSEELDRFNRELRQLDDMKSQLLANVSHELQTPLVSIRGYTEMTLKGRLGAVNDDQRRGLELSLRNIDRLISMIDSLLEFSRMERELGELDLSEFSLADLVEDCKALMQPKIDAKRIAWVTRFDDPDLVIHADRDKIHQVFVNLVNNAIKFNHEAGRIEIGAQRKSSTFAQVEVRDTGVGISREDLDRIFDRYYQVEDDAEQPVGTGLGLSIVRNLLRLHGCTIRAESEEGKGTVFWFTLPLAEHGEDRREKPSDDDAESDPNLEPHGGGPVPSEAVRVSPEPAMPRSAEETDRSAEEQPAAALDRPRLRIIRPVG